MFFHVAKPHVQRQLRHSRNKKTKFYFDTIVISDRKVSCYDVVMYDHISSATTFEKVFS
jgi:hypothetical protein